DPVCRNLTQDSAHGNTWSGTFDPPHTNPDDDPYSFMQLPYNATQQTSNVKYASDWWQTYNEEYTWEQNHPNIPPYQNGPIGYATGEITDDGSVTDNNRHEIPAAKATYWGNLQIG